MDVVKSTINSLLPEIQDAILQSDFIAIDTELTGLSAGTFTNYSPLDTPQERYSKLRQSTHKFTITQYGICCFIWDIESKSYISRPFNFYLFPATAKFPFKVYERNFLCQVASIEFLATNGFDFNRWVKEGIPYCSKENELYIKTQIAGLSKTENDIMIDGNNEEFVATNLNRVQEWRQNSAEKFLELDAQSFYHKKLLAQQIRKNFANHLALNLKEQSVEVVRLTEEEREQGLGDPTLQLEKMLEEYIGFRKVIDIISKSGKPMIGHNMYLDLTHTYNCFVGALPENWEDFKKLLNKHFPIIYDTKHICHAVSKLAPHFPDSSLENVYRITNETPFSTPTINIHSAHSRYANDTTSYHEAGWDAHATGAAFARLVAFFQEQSESHSRVSFGNDRLLALLNRLNIMSSDLAYLHLTDADDKPDRTAVLHLYDFPKEWKNKNIELLFDSNKFGAITLQWINDVSSFIKFEDSIKSEAALAQYQMKNGDTPFKLQRYADHVKVENASLKRSASNSVGDSWYNNKCIIFVATIVSSIAVFGFITRCR